MRKNIKSARHNYALFVLLIVCLLFVLAVTWYFASIQQASAPATQPLPASPTPDTSHTVSVYFSKHPQSDDNPGETYPVQRTTQNNNVASFAMSELLHGPSTGEQTDGYFATARIRAPASASSCNDQDFTLTITNATATLTFCRTFDHIGEISDGQAESEIKATLLQFPTIKKVIILNGKGDCEFNLSGQNLCLQ